LGVAGDDAVEVPPTERMARALEVLGFVQRVEVLCLGRMPESAGGLLSPDPESEEPTYDSITVELADEAAGRVDLSLAAAAGREAVLAPDDERAVRALLQAPPLSEMGPPPPARLVALMGVLKALDGALAERVLPLAQSNATRVAGSRLPRENTRKAPLVRSVTAQMEGRFAGFPTHRVEEVAGAATDGKLVARFANAADTAVLLALFGRRWNAGGRDVERVVDLGPLTDEEIEELVRELSSIAVIRKQLESGKSMEPARITRLEQALVAVLGRLGRVS
nr:hypothetical protein [Planctomycetota bacterium]